MPPVVAVDPSISTCCTCGYSWKTGTHGGHICSESLQAEIARVKRKLETAEAVNHLSNLSLNAQEKRHKEQVAKLNANYIQVMTERDQLRAKHKAHHEEAERLSKENEELSKARYQLNTIKEAFRFLTK